MADALDQFSAILDGAARRHSPPEAVAKLDAADSGYAQLVRIEEAARRRGGDPGRFSPTQFDAAVQSASGGVRSKAYLRGDALMSEYAQAGKKLVDTIPNSGSADRIMAGQAAGSAAGGGMIGLGAIEPTTLATMGAAAIPYLPGVRKATQGLMAPRGTAQQQRLIEELRRRSYLGGTAFSPLGIQYASINSQN